MFLLLLKKMIMFLDGAVGSGCFLFRTCIGFANGLVCSEHRKAKRTFEHVGVRRGAGVAQDLIVALHDHLLPANKSSA